MTSVQVTRQGIIDLLKSDIHACDELFSLLEQERTALQERDHDALDSIIHAKASHLQQLENSAITRSRWAEAYKNSQQNTDEKWQQLVSEQTPEVVTLWHTLKDALKKCRTENEVNGKILARNQKTFTRLMSILRGQTGSTSLYNNKGSNNTHLPGQTIGKA